MECQVRICLARDKWIISVWYSVVHVFPKALQCACDCFLWGILIADLVMKGEKGCMPAVGPALPMQFCRSKFSHPDWDISSSVFHGRLGRGSTLCVCVPCCGKAASEEDWAKPSVCALEGIMEGSHDNLCCQSSDPWQGKRTVYLTAANNFQRDQVLNCSHHCEILFQLLP